MDNKKQPAATKPTDATTTRKAEKPAATTAPAAPAVDTAAADAAKAAAKAAKEAEAAKKAEEAKAAKEAAKKAKEEAKAAKKAEREAKVAEPRIVKVQEFKLNPEIKAQSNEELAKNNKGQRLQVLLALKDLTGSVTVQDVVDNCPELSTDQPAFAVVAYHVKRMIEEKMITVTGEREVEVARRVRKPKTETPAVEAAKA